MLNLLAFLLMSFTTQNSSQILVITAYAEGNYSFPQAAFHPTAERGGGNYDLLYQNLIRKYEDDLEY